MHQQSLQGHKDRVTCLCLTEDGKFLVSGSEDTTLLVWNVITDQRSRTSRGNLPARVPIFVEPHPPHILYGHSSRVTAVAASSEQDVCVSGSYGTVMIHKLRRGDYVRHVALVSPKTSEALYIDMVVMDTYTGNWIAYSKGQLLLQLYSVNGRLIHSLYTSEHIADMCITSDAKYLVTGGQKNQ
eukprot:TRINITY_DN11452_c0_g3_i2.p1 TRINITY_DN11452_c0_g3~~TRINITY_DN11452_c0_g3_i2.p1  ORF type:complete len:184 (-),score=29.06 TRINITY_DN11452_c0_g3_i2:632-1183(-)